MSINWQDLRPLNNSQYKAFEELCRQLARYEEVDQDSTFIAKGDPDGGVECYWKLSTGNEWGWQAKFFRSSPNPSQWSQMDGSVKTALEKHPMLSRYTICLPINRSDPRTKEQESFMDKWNGHVEKWKEWVQERKMSVEFEYWGEDEILERLSRDEHRGRFFFWFKKEFFSKQWFEHHIEEVISCVGLRYTPELNVDLPIANLFDGLGRTSRFFALLRDFYGEIARSYKKTRLDRMGRESGDEVRLLHDTINKLLSFLRDIWERNIEKDNMEPIDWNCLDNLIDDSLEIVSRCRTILENASKKPKNGSYSDDLDYERYLLRELSRNLNTLQDFVQSTQAELSNKPALLVVGRAGAGKTHLFCDVTEQRIQSNLPTLLLLGEHFNNEEPWSQIIKSTGTSSREEFLGALEAAAQAQGARALILIDALNEGEGKSLWYKYLAGMLTTLSRYPWIGIAVSVRTSYENIVIPEHLVSDKLLREEHYGFADHEYQATQTFFEYYEIEQPSIPLLIPEFQNPLFLRLFCQGLKNSGLTKIPRGFRGATRIFDFFIESIDKKLHRPDYLDFDPNSRIVQLAADCLAEQMADRSRSWLPREEAKNIVDGFLPYSGYEKSLFRHLISEGVITEDRFWTGDSDWCDGVHFSFERFGDHLIAKHLLDKHLDRNDPSKSFASGTPLGALMEDLSACWRNRGIIEAFSVQLPERIGKELVEIAGYCAGYHPVCEAFVESLVWRDTKAITRETSEYINKCISNHDDLFDQFLNVMVTLASDPEHPYNADFLHEHLMKYTLAERDAQWSIFIFEQYGEHEAVDRLIDWAWSPEDKSHIDDESARLCGIALTWFLTTSNRYLRDRATKALVNLLTKRIHILRRIIHIFLDVNDPYVLERLLAAAYGCAMRSVDNIAVGELAQDVYECIFESGEPPPDILLRDCARGIIELALHHGSPLDIDVEKIRPPYRSKWPSNIPTEEELKKYDWHEGISGAEFGRTQIYGSVMSSGDFARYIIGTNMGHFPWSAHRLGEPRELTREEIYENFVSSLTGRQRKAWEHYRSCQACSITDNLRRFLGESEILDSSNNRVTHENSKSLEKAKESFCRTLGKKKLRIYEEIVVPYLNDPDRHKDEFKFDLSIAQRWIFQRVFDLGWTVEYFGDFDRRISLLFQRRGADKPERIGKKYQWIAYHEFLARVSDNFEFRGDSWPSRPENYDGPWQIDVRDIDPSCLLKKTEKRVWELYKNTWWFPSEYNDWDSEPDDVKWLKNTDDIPCIDSLLEVRDADGVYWLALQGHYDWEQPTPPEEERLGIPRREIRYMIRSYIVKKSDADELHDWMRKQNFMDHGMPESHRCHRIFLGEFFWSPGCNYYFSEYSDYKEWTRGIRDCVPKEVLVTVEEYSWELGDYDCSLDEGISIYLPTKWLANNMRLQWNGSEGQFFDENGNLIAFDPSVRNPGPGVLLVSRDVFLEFLNDSGYDILWTINGRKSIIGGETRSDWKGQLELNGVYRIDNGRVCGKMNKKFVS